MDEVTISKQKLLDQLKKNREDHKEIYELAYEGWKAEVIKALEEALEDAKADKDFITYFDIDKPESHLSEYDEIIDRVSWHEDSVIKLNLREFNNFVRDNWDWSVNFLNQATMYSSSSSSSSSSSAVSTLREKLKKLSS